MLRRVVPLVAAVALAAPASASAEDPWRTLSTGTHALDRAEMSAALRSGRVDLPAPGGGFQRFAVREAPVMEPGLARRHPEIATYGGRGIDDPAASVRLDLGPLGFHASVRSPGGTWYVDPAGGAYRARHARNVPFVEGEITGDEAPLAPGGPTTGSERRIYRLALASDPTFATRAGGPANVTAAKVTLTSRMSQIFEDEASIALRLIEGNDRLNLDTPTLMSGRDGPCGTESCYPEETSCGSETLDRNVFVLDRIVGADSFDVGHILIGRGGIGIAQLGVVGGPGKARGCSSRAASAFVNQMADVLAHELGHQFGASHTFNGSECGNISPSNSVEPGSGSTILSYAGLCGSDDLQDARDAVWSQRSFQQIVSHVTSSPGAGGFIVEPTGNSAPAVSAPDAFTIPLRTPFALTGSASDADGDPVTYKWEQNDRGADLVRGGQNGIPLPSNAKANGPLFRVPRAPSADPTRVLPNMELVLANRTNARTGTCFPVDLPCFSEFLPTADYVGVEGVNADPPSLHFRLTARDGRGGASSADTALTLAPGTGPFLVTSPNTEVRLPSGSTQTVTWDVAGTDRAPIGASHVRVRLSTNSGETFGHMLVASTPNDGAAEVELPEIDTARARIRIEAVGNVFFDVSDADFLIGTAPALPAIAPVGDFDLQHSDRPGASRAAIRASDADTPGSELTATATGLPEGVTLAVDSTSDGPAPGARSWRLAGAVAGAPGTYRTRVTVTDETGGERTTAFDVTVRPEDAQVAYAGDELAVDGTAVQLRAIVRDDADADRGDVRGATVSFRSESRTLCAAVPVAPLGDEPTLGSAHCDATLDPGPHAIAIAVDGSHAGTARADVELVPADGARALAAASLRIASSAGAHAGDPGSLTSVAFTARSDVDGGAVVHLRSGGRSVVAIAGDLESAGIARGAADLRARATVLGAKGVLARDATLRITATDEGPQGDALGVTLWDGDRLLFASEWNGLATIERPLHVGGVLVTVPPISPPPPRT